MASTFFEKSKTRWRVAWINTAGTRVSRRFHTEAQAREFAATVTDERMAAPGPRPVAWTTEFVKAKIHRSVHVDGKGCWIWQPKGGTNKYAQIVRRTTDGLKTVLMHRASYEAFVGPIPDGLEIDHLCAVTLCVNPEHLEPVTQAENLRRRDERKQVSA